MPADYHHTRQKSRASLRRKSAVFVVALVLLFSVVSVSNTSAAWLPEFDLAPVRSFAAAMRELYEISFANTLHSLDRFFGFGRSAETEETASEDNTDANGSSRTAAVVPIPSSEGTAANESSTEQSEPTTQTIAQLTQAVEPTAPPPAPHPTPTIQSTSRVGAGSISAFREGFLALLQSNIANLRNEFRADINSITSRIPPVPAVGTQPIVYHTVQVRGPKVTDPPQRMQSITAATGDFREGLGTGGNFTATGEEITVGSEQSDITITSKTWNVTAAGEITNVTNLSTENLTVTNPLKVSAIQGALTAYNGLTAPTFTATSTTASSTFAFGIQAKALDITSTTATSTFANGIQLTGGCLLLPSGSCANLSGSGSFNAGTANRLAYYSGANVIDSADFLTVDSGSNRIGVGTTSPGRTVDISGSLRIQRSGTPHIELIQDSADAYNKRWRLFGGSNGEFRIQARTDDNQDIGSHFVITRDYFVGINDNDPDFGLEIATSSAAGHFAISSDKSGDGDIFMVDGSGNVGVGTTSPWAFLSINADGIAGPAFAIGSSTQTDFVVTNGGNAGIGTTSPTDKLTIYDDTDSAVMLGRSGTGNTAVWRYNSFEMEFGTVVADDTTLIANNVEKLRIDGDSAGHVGIGDHTQFSSAVIQSTNLPGTSLVIGQGAFCVDDGGNNCDDISRDSGSFYVLGSGDSYIAGNVGIGTTSPSTGVHIENKDVRISHERVWAGKRSRSNRRCCSRRLYQRKTAFQN